MIPEFLSAAVRITFCADTVWWAGDGFLKMKLYTVDQFWLSVYIYLFASFTGGTARFFYFSSNSGQLFDASGTLHESLAESTESK